MSTNPTKRQFSKDQETKSERGQSPKVMNENEKGRDPLFDDFEEEDPLVCENRSMTRDNSENQDQESFVRSERPESES